MLTATERPGVQRKGRSNQGAAGAGGGALTRAERAAAGKAARATTPLEAHAEFQPTASRDPVGLLLKQAQTRVPELVPIRHGRMAVSPFTFYRGAALVMAADLYETPSPGLRVQLCGDAHLSNFGVFGSPERSLLFDINDFDETLPGPFEWDVKRLAASLVVAGRGNGFTAKESRKLAQAAAESYRTTMRDFAMQPILAVWYAHLNIQDFVAEFRAALSARKLKENKARMRATDSLLAKAHTRDSLQAVGKLTTAIDGTRRIVSDPPLIIPIEELADELDVDALRKLMDNLLGTYRGSLQSDRRKLFDNFVLADVAHKVVGVGSVGTRAWIMLMRSGDDSDLLLQAKEAEASVLSDYAGASEYTHHGERVVAGQHLMQAASDIFLGWFRAPAPRVGGKKDYYMRQLRDWKASVEVETMDPVALDRYARLCGWTLARAHARSGDRIAIAAYLGKSNKFDLAIAEFAERYADQNDVDYAALSAAIAAGRVEAQAGV